MHILWSSDSAFRNLSYVIRKALQFIELLLSAGLVHASPNLILTTTLLDVMDVYYSLFTNEWGSEVRLPQGLTAGTVSYQSLYSTHDLYSTHGLCVCLSPFLPQLQRYYTFHCAASWWLVTCWKDRIKWVMWFGGVPGFVGLIVLLPEHHHHLLSIA